MHLFDVSDYKPFVVSTPQPPREDGCPHNALNMAEIELNVLNNQCLGMRIKDIKTVKEEVAAWENDRNRIDKKISWQFTCSDARVKLQRLYSSYHC
jgi:hypothetical protein